MQTVLTNTFSLWLVEILVTNLVIAVAGICLLRYLQGVLSGVNTTQELSKKDNFAFGLSLAGSAIALALIMSAAVGGDGAENLKTEGFNVLVYALAGTILLKVGSLINDLLIFHQFSIKEQISKENMAAGLVQAANFLALGLIIQAAINWGEAEDYTGLFLVAVVFLCSQLLLIAVTVLRSTIYRRRHNGEQLHVALESGHVALAIRYAGHLLGSALAISAASAFVEHSSFWFWEAVAAWFLVALALILVLSVLSAVARSIILRRINVVEEVDEQHNHGVAFIEAAIFIAIGLILKALMA
ncbi:MAG: DUF350 domain-containing protein [Spongiibacteraceae bacterium]|nr:DUF350 domain-containing protein [Spongiibacteraceae bacterium]